MVAAALCTPSPATDGAGAASVTARAQKRGRCTLRVDDSSPARGVRQPLIGTTRRRDGRQQVTYNGRPLYYYIGDKSPGQVLCQNVDEFGGTWLVLRQNGQLVR
jgi:predicted lipoprotein with Yx(FWY)xxD motif